jgi:hypothetical protein
VPPRQRPNMRNAAPPAGAGSRAFFDDTPPAAGTADGGQSTVDLAARWDDTHRRWTVWLSVELVDAINAAVAATGHSRASLVEAALRADPTIAEHLS